MSFPEENFPTTEDVATEWAVRRAEGLTRKTQAEFESWLASDPANYAAFAEADLALSVLTRSHDELQRQRLREELSSWEARRTERRTRRKWITFSGLGLASAAALIIGFFPFVSKRAPNGPTMAVRPHLQHLPDGTVVELNASSEIAVDFSKEFRAVRLLHGEAHFAVAKDKSRPFVVSVGPVKVRAVGTGFNVRYEQSAVQVLVTEGTVAVANDSSDSTPASAQNNQAPQSAPASSASGVSVQSKIAGASPEMILTAGYRTVILLTRDLGTKPNPSALPESEIRQVLAWREMRFELSNATLDQAVALFNRKGRMQLAIEDEELRERRISGIYWADNSTQFAELIESTLEIKAVRQASDRIVFRKQ